MLSGFGASLSFEMEDEHEHGLVAVEDEEGERDERGYDDWLLQRKVKIPQRDEWDEGELGDSCCFGTRTVKSAVGMDCVGKLHGGI
jgi:hypothetical protein